MKKFVSFLICFNIFSTNIGLALNVIEDNLTNYLNKDLKIEKTKYIPIEDDFANKTLNKNVKTSKSTYQPIYDDFTNRTLNKNLKIEKTAQKPIKDELISNIKIEKIEKTQNKTITKLYDYKAKVYPLAYHTTKRGLKEGEYIDFAIAQDVKIKNVVYKKGTPIKARVENISMNSAYGVPADLIIGNFTLPDKTILNGEISVKGANRTLWVYPTGYVLTLFFFVGLPIFAIRGGHAKLKPEKIYEIEI